jgi:hypothetical protein
MRYTCNLMLAFFFSFGYVEGVRRRAGGKPS